MSHKNLNKNAAALFLVSIEISVKRHMVRVKKGFCLAISRAKLD